MQINKLNKMIKIPKIKIDVVHPEQRKVKPLGYGVIIEKRYPKVKTDENKLFGTNETHKYY